MKNTNPPSIALPLAHSGLTGSPLQSLGVFFMKQEYLKIIQEYTKDYPDVLIDEEWKDHITGNSIKYKISNYGRVARLHPFKNKWKLYKFGISLGYYRTRFCHKNVYLHRLVAKYFMPKINGKNFINHKNANKLDNRVDNLEWCTLNENNQHAIINGLIDTKGEKHFNAIITDEIARAIKIEIKKHEVSCRKLAEIMNVSKHIVHNIKYNKGWKHIKV